MRINDPALPAAQYLVGESAIDLLRVPVEATGGVLHSARPVQVQYRPGSDVVVRYSAQVSWAGGPVKRDTLVAASAVHGTYPDVVPITADTPAGPVAVGVWRWPYDPVLLGLGDVVTVGNVAPMLGLDATDLSLDIVAYRPTERAVIKVSRDTTAVAYVKIVAPRRVGAIADRHAALLDAGVPAPRVLQADADRGLVVMEAIGGPTLRDLVKGEGADAVWPEPTAFIELSEHLRQAEIDGDGPPSRISDGALHADMLATVVPTIADRLDRLASSFRSAGPPEIDGVVHGDLHEGQLVIDDGHIVGVLDIDDAGPGASIDDLANLIARLHYRIVTGSGDATRLQAYAAQIRAVAAERHVADRLDLHTAAALVGLATGPFRLQSAGWRTSVDELVGCAASFAP